MRVTKDKGSELHDADETREVEDFGVGVSTIENAREIEEFCTLINFSPEPLLENLLGVLESGGLFDKVKVSQYPNNLREAVRLKYVQELERFLLLTRYSAM